MNSPLASARSRVGPLVMMYRLRAWLRYEAYHVFEIFCSFILS